MAVNDFEFALHVFDQRGATLHPIAAVHVGEILDLFDFCTVDMTADYPVHLVFRGHLHHRIFVFANILNRALGFHFQVGGKRPVAEAQTASDAICVEVDIEYEVIEPGTDSLQQPVESSDPVKLMTVQNEVSPAVHAKMNRSLQKLHAAELHPGEILEELIMIAVEKGNLGVFPVFTKQLLDKRVVGADPVPASLELPAVNEVAHDVNKIRFVIPQELEKRIHLGVFGSQVNV